MTTFLTSYIDSFMNFIKLFFKFTALALFSPEFYQDVYKKFYGWGIRYIFTAIFIATIINFIPIFYNLQEIKKYLITDTYSEATKDLEYIINQLPTLDYDGQSIHLDEEEPYYIFNKHGKKIIVIDRSARDNKQYTNEMIILSQDKFILNFKSFDPKNLLLTKVFLVDYKQILGKKPIKLTTFQIKALLKNILEASINSLTYILLPIMLLIRLLVIILLKLFNIMIIYIFLNMFVGKALIKDAFRLVMFSSSLPVMLTIISPNFFAINNIAFMIELWSLMLMMFSLYKLVQRS